MPDQEKPTEPPEPPQSPPPEESRPLPTPPTPEPEWIQESEDLGDIERRES